MSIQDLKPLWALHFKLDDSTWARIEKQSLITQCTPLEIALDSGFINPEQFLEWDRDTSRTAALKIDFFNSPPPLKLFEKFDYVDCRQKVCMPVTEWEGKIYWAKLSSTPTGLEKEGSEKYWFLAPWPGLKKWFEAWKAVALSNSEKAPTPLAAFVEPPHLPSLNKEISSEIVPGEPISLKEVKDSSAPKFTLAPTLSGSPQNSFPPTLVEPKVETIILDTSLTPSSPGITHSSISSHVPSSTGSKVKSVEPPTGLKNITPNATAAIDFSSLLGAPVPPLPTISKDPRPVKPSEPENIVYFEAVENIPTPKPLTKPIAKPEASTKPIPTIPLDQFESRMRLAATQDGLAETFMGAWQNYFQQVMILLFQNEQLCIWWDNSQFNGQFNRGEVISLEESSVFKIVADTMNPYHGYVSPGPINDKFFQLTNGSQYPEHLTIVPVVSGDHVVAMLLGTCGEEAGKTIILHKLEEDAKLFCSSLLKTSAALKNAS